MLSLLLPACTEELPQASYTGSWSLTEMSASRDDGEDEMEGAQISGTLLITEDARATWQSTREPDEDHRGNHLELEGPATELAPLTQVALSLSGALVSYDNPEVRFDAQLPLDCDLYAPVLHCEGALDSDLEEDSYWVIARFEAAE